jgi:ABC-type multidrug transport system ATPase subunit
MTISLSDAGKRFNRDWIFRHLTFNFEAGQSYAITGPNGSGKSTLLQVLSGAMQVSEGNLQYTEKSQIPIAIGTKVNRQNGEQSFNGENIYQQVSICAPYLEVVEEMSLIEFLLFHQNFKPLLPGISLEKIILLLGLEKTAKKQIRYFSSGMKQRVKLAQCIFSDTSIVLLDEPCTNLDLDGIHLYHRLMDEYCKDRLVIVSSNDEVEYRFCEHRMSIMDYK